MCLAIRNEKIVTQLLDNGAVINEAEADQLLGAAIYTGSIEMVDLFVANGAKIKPDHVFSALSRKRFELTSALLDSVGIPNLDDNTLDTLTQEAEQYGHGELADVLLDVIAARENKGHLRLLFETADADRCRLETWDPTTRAIHENLLDDYSCDAGLFVSRQKSSLFVLEGDGISVLSLNKAFSTFKLNVPAQEIESRLDEIREQFTQRIGGTHDWVTAKNSGHRAILATGKLA